MNKNFKTIFLSVIITFTILFPISAFTTINILKNNSNKKIETSKIKYNIPKTQDMTMLFVISQTLNQSKNNKKNPPLKTKDEDSKEKYLILKISAHDNKIVISDIPTNFKTTAQTNNGYPIEEGTLKTIFHNNGINQLKNSIEQIMKIEINNTVRIDKNTTDTIINQLGGIKSKNKEKNEISKTENFYNLLNEKPKEAILLLKNSFTKKININKFFATLSNLSFTDISIYDFENRKKGFKKMIEEQNAKLITPKIEIINKNSRDTLTEKSLKEIKEAYK